MKLLFPIFLSFSVCFLNISCVDKDTEKLATQFSLALYKKNYQRATELLPLLPLKEQIYFDPAAVAKGLSISTNLLEHVIYVTEKYDRDLNILNGWRTVCDFFGVKTTERALSYAFVSILTLIMLSKGVFGPLPRSLIALMVITLPISSILSLVAAGSLYSIDDPRVIQKNKSIYIGMIQIVIQRLKKEGGFDEETKKVIKRACSGDKFYEYKTVKLALETECEAVKPWGK
jgi:hypothetical protein